MHDRRTRLMGIFEDTQAFYREDDVLRKAVTRGINRTKLYEADDYPELQAEQSGAGKISVIQSKTFEAACKYHKSMPDKKITVLNFASATHPGGGVKKGSSAQEESLCRCSTLYPTLDIRWLKEKYYKKNYDAHNNLYSDACIYSPDVVICKTDEDYPKRMKQEEFVTVDVISCAAPNLRKRPSNPYNPAPVQRIQLSSSEQYKVHCERGKHILHVAAANHADILILGAFGCGAFENDPVSVSSAYRDILDEYRGYFEEIVFAIYYRGHEEQNYRAFQNAFKERV